MKTNFCWETLYVPYLWYRARRLTPTLADSISISISSVRCPIQPVDAITNNSDDRAASDLAHVGQTKGQLNPGGAISQSELDRFVTL
jgi:hypothetical protein